MRQAGRRAPGVDTALLLEDVGKLLPEPSRRLFLRNAASLGALTLLTGCDVVDGRTAEKALRVVSQFNDWVQARLFNPNRLAPTYAESAIKLGFKNPKFVVGLAVLNNYTGGYWEDQGYNWFSGL